MKKCSKCKVEKPLTLFHKNNNKKDGHQYACKACDTKRSAKYKAKYYAENKAEQPNCVYQIKNLENNKSYIGQTTRGELRWKEHLKRLRGNYHPNKLLKADFDKYGEEVLEWTILKEFEDGDESTLLLEEARTIQQFITEGVELYNLILTIDQLKMLRENK